MLFSGIARAVLRRPAVRRRVVSGLTSDAMPGSPLSDPTVSMVSAGTGAVTGGAPIPLPQCTVLGQETQILDVVLPPRSRIYSEPGALFHKDVNVTTETNMPGGFFEGLKRSLFLGESMFRPSFDNPTDQPRRLALSPSFPAKLQVLQLDEWGPVIARKGSFLAATREYHMEVAFRGSFTAKIFGGQGFILQRYVTKEPQNTLFLYGGGVVQEYELGATDSMHVSAGSLLCFQDTVTYDVEMQKGLKNILFSGNGLFLVRLQGPGRVMLHSMPFERTVDEILARMPHVGGGIVIGDRGGRSSEGDEVNESSSVASETGDVDLSEPAPEEEEDERV